MIDKPKILNQKGIAQTLLHSTKHQNFRFNCILKGAKIDKWSCQFNSANQPHKKCDIECHLHISAISQENIESEGKKKLNKKPM